MEQEDSRDDQDNLSYLVVANDQDDAFDNVDTETLLAEMSAGRPCGLLVLTPRMC